MKVSDIISRVRNIAGDVEVLQFSDSSIMAWINDAMREVASDNQLLQKTATTTVESEVAEYDLPTDILKLHSIRYNNVPLRIITMEEAKSIEDTSVGTPTVAWVWAGKLNLWPTPDAKESLKVDYTRNPTEVTGEQDIPEVPSSYHMRLVDYCLAQVAQQDDDMNRYAMKMEEFRTGVSNLKDQPEWENNLYPVITYTEGDMYDQY